MVKKFKTMPKGLILVPIPNNPARYSVWDPAGDCYLKGGINLTRVRAEMLGASYHPSHWETVAKSKGWSPSTKQPVGSSVSESSTPNLSDPAGLNDEGAQ